MEGKRVNDTRIIMAAQMNPEDANPAGNVHGGVIMKYVDTAAGAVAIRHARRIAVTASIDRLDFHHPVFVGNLLILKASLNFVGKTSMEVGVRVEAENLLTGDVRHTASAYLTFVALDQTGKPAEVPPLILVFCPTNSLWNDFDCAMFPIKQTWRETTTWHGPRNKKSHFLS
ncbi:MAG: acyl-CoA thioesterase, partial [Thermodesulfobacteriota bacterium]